MYGTRGFSLGCAAEGIPWSRLEVGEPRSHGPMHCVEREIQNPGVMK